VNINISYYKAGDLPMNDNTSKTFNELARLAPSLEAWQDNLQKQTPHFMHTV
jgi:hypothetical protein